MSTPSCADLFTFISTNKYIPSEVSDGPCSLPSNDFTLTANDGVTGTLPPELWASLPDVDYISIRGNSISGYLPTEVRHRMHTERRC